MPQIVRPRPGYLPGGRPETMQDAQHRHQTRSAGQSQGQSPQKPFRRGIASVRRSLAGKGEAVSEAAPSVGGSAPAGQVDAEAPAAQLIRRVLRAAQDLDPLGLQAQLDLGAAVLGLTRCVDEIVILATQELRRMLAGGLCDAAQQLMATEAVRTWLNHRGSFAPSPQEIGPILLACGPRDLHIVDLECLALLLRYRRWPCRVLGTRISPFTLTIAAQASYATGVVVSSTEERGRSHAVLSLKAVDALHIPVFFTGDAFNSEESRLQLPGRYLGTGIQGACALLIDALARPAGHDQPSFSSQCGRSVSSEGGAGGPPGRAPRRTGRVPEQPSARPD